LADQTGHLLSARKPGCAWRGIIFPYSAEATTPQEAPAWTRP
jgi:hypothetical protein